MNTAIDVKEESFYFYFAVHANKLYHYSVCFVCVQVQSSPRVMNSHHFKTRAKELRLGIMVNISSIKCIGLYRKSHFKTTTTTVVITEVTKT